MLRSHFAPLGAVILFLSSTVGCAAESASATNEEAVSADSALSTQTFTLYGEPGEEPTPRCDVHTVLTLSAQQAGVVGSPFAQGTMVLAHLKDTVDGTCKLGIHAEPRSYRLFLDGNECGSVIYKANVTVDGESREITVTDHRSRVCKDVVPAKMIVDEADAGGKVRTLYSSDSSRTPSK
jgi:hypothetical protein